MSIERQRITKAADILGMESSDLEKVLYAAKVAIQPVGLSQAHALDIINKHLLNTSVTKSDRWNKVARDIVFDLVEAGCPLEISVDLPLYQPTKTTGLSQYLVVVCGDVNASYIVTRVEGVIDAYAEYVLGELNQENRKEAFDSCADMSYWSTRDRVPFALEHVFEDGSFSAYLMPNSLVRESGSQWQPIETAPKDGTAIIVCNPEFSADNMAVVVWEDNGWCYDDSPMNFYFGATHWMPLPKPPLTKTTSIEDGTGK